MLLIADLVGGGGATACWVAACQGLSETTCGGDLFKDGQANDSASDFLDVVGSNVGAIGALVAVQEPAAEACVCVCV